MATQNSDLIRKSNFVFCAESLKLFSDFLGFVQFVTSYQCFVISYFFTLYTHPHPHPPPKLTNTLTHTHTPTFILPSTPIIHPTPPVLMKTECLFHEACRSCDVSLIKKLLHDDEDVNIRDQVAAVCLMVAIVGLMVSIVGLLVAIVGLMCGCCVIDKLLLYG